MSYFRYAPASGCLTAVCTSSGCLTVNSVFATEWRLLFPGRNFKERILHGTCTTRQHKMAEECGQQWKSANTTNKETTNDKVVGCELKQQTKQTEDNKQGFGWLVENGINNKDEISIPKDNG